MIGQQYEWLDSRTTDRSTLYEWSDNGTNDRTTVQHSCKGRPTVQMIDIPYEWLGNRTNDSSASRASLKYGFYLSLDDQGL